MKHVPDWYSRMREMTKREVTWLDEVYFFLGFKTWPGSMHIEEAFMDAVQPISLHEAIAIAAVNEDRKYNQNRLSV